MPFRIRKDAPSASPRPQRIAFDNFEVDLRSGEVRKSGARIRLQAQPFQLLVLLLENAGEVVTREEICRQLWTADTFVDFEHSLAAAVNKIRDALGDSADNPKYIETLPKRGYRFIGKIKSEPPVVLLPLGTQEPAGLAAAPGELVPRSRPSAEVIDSIALLPFENASGNPETEYLSDGITESIINSLSRLPKLRVIPRSTAFRYKGQTVDSQAVGRELKVRAVLGGRVLQRGEMLVIGTELIDTVEQAQLWGERYNRRMAEIFTIEDEIAKKISEGLRIRLSGDEEKRLTKRFTQDTKAYQLYLKGRYYWAKRTPETLKKALEYFRQAVEEDPDYALAYAGLADCYIVLAWQGVVAPKEGLPQAKAAAMKAVGLDDDLAEAHTALANSLALHDSNWLGAERELKRSIQLDPAYWYAHTLYGLCLAALGRHEEAIEAVRRGEKLEPLLPVIEHHVAWVLYMAGQYDRAIDHCCKALEIEPNYALLHWWLAQAYEQTGQFKKAVTESKKALHLAGGELSFLAGFLGHALAVAGRKVEAQEILRDLIGLSNVKYSEPFGIAAIHAGLGERDQALEWLQKSCDEMSPFVSMFLKVDPKFESLRSDPRFADLLRRMNLQL